MNNGKTRINKHHALIVSAISALAALAAAVAGSDEPRKTRARIRVIEPADPGLIPEGRRLLDYLHAAQGQGMLTGVSRVGGGPEPVLHGTGREPAIRHLQAAFFLVPNLAAPTVETARQWWHEKGGLVQFHFHWNNFMRGTTWKGSPTGGPADLEKALTPGTDEYKTFHKELSVVADHLEQLAKANVPVLWTPFHEIDGGWFWWTSPASPPTATSNWAGERLGKTPAGYHNLMAFARDAEGAVAYSNAARITTGLQNLARGKKATASSVSPHGGPPEDAVDGDPFSMWWSDNRQDDPQWLMVDLGAEKRVGAVGVSWWKAHATHYTVQASSDGEDWREVARIEGRRAPQGDSDLIRFDPVPARYLRLHCTKRAVTWQAYCVGELAAYERLPEHK